MYQLDFNRPARVHFIGIGGISMSGLAEVLLDRGFAVSGSDMKRSELTDRLQEKGAAVCIGQCGENISADTEVVVYTAAIRPTNPEYAEAVRRGLPMLSRAELLGELMRNYQTAIAVSGTHGKTTTTSMLAEILLAAEKDPTVSVGGMLRSIGGNIRVGSSDLFLTEACEYTNSFLSFYPTLAVILNIREDHLDFFRDLEDIRHSFRRFAELLPQEGTLIINSGIENWRQLTEGLHCRVLSVGTEPDDDYRMSEISWRQDGCADFTVTGADGESFSLSLRVPGAHNIENALAAAAAARVLGLAPAEIAAGLSAFTGTDRRFEKKGSFCGVTVIDDYAHHPDEIRATLSTARQLEANRVICVFQPHTYSRTKALMDQFAEALSLADLVVLTEIYPARETDTLGVSSAQLAEKIRQAGTEALSLESFDAVEKFLLENSVNGDLLITMGAGDVVKIGESLLGR